MKYYETTTAKNDKNKGFVDTMSIEAIWEPNFLKDSSFH